MRLIIVLNGCINVFGTFIFMLKTNKIWKISIIKNCIKYNQTLAVAESCTGGLIGDRVTNVPGSSKVFKGGVVAYSNESKVKILGVSKYFRSIWLR